MIPLRFGPPACFRHLRVFLQESGYLETVVCQRLGVRAQHEILGRRSQKSAEGAQDAADLLIRLFLTGEYSEESELLRLFRREALECLWELGLLARHVSKPCLVYSPACLYPMRQLYITSDRWTHPDGSSTPPRADIVYPAITRNTYRFLSLLPHEPCDRLLDLCTGSGVAALLSAAGHSRQAWAVDVTERSARFAEFNRLLNGIDNASILEGDLYQPVAGLSFDRILAHPPYLPSASTRWIFQDAGPQGEDITRRIVEGLVWHLSPGGRLYCLSLGVDQQDTPLEERIRGWLGEHETEFDVLLAVVETHTPEQIASQPLLKGEITQGEFVSRKAAFAGVGIENFVYGLIVIQRIGEAKRTPFTARRQVGARTGSAEIEWAVRWESVAASPEAASLLLESRPVPARDLELRVSHHVEQGTLAPTDFTLQAEYPFCMESRVHPWTAALVGVCDGVKTGRELHAYCVNNALISSAVPPEDFGRFLGSLVSGGFLEIEGSRLPHGAG